MSARSETGGNLYGVAADGAGLMVNVYTRLQGRRNLRLRCDHGHRVEEISQYVARQVNVHHQRLGLGGPVRNGAEKLEGESRIPQLGRDHMVASLPFEESNRPVKDTVSLKQFAQDVEDAVVCEILHAFERHAMRKWFCHCI